MSPHTVAKLRELKIDRKYTFKEPRAVTAADLREADCIVVLSQSEHEPYLRESWSPLDRLPLVYWHVDDVALAKPAAALPIVVREVRALVAGLKAGRSPFACAKPR